MKLKPWNLADHLVTQEDIVAYVNTCLAEGDAALIVNALRALAQKKEADTVAGTAAVAPDGNAHALRKSTEFNLTWLLCTLRALGLEMHVRAAASS